MAFGGGSGFRFGSAPIEKGTTKRTFFFGDTPDDSPSTSIARLVNKTDERENVNHKNEVFDAFSRMKSEGIACDFVIKIGGEEIRVHRAVLIASSKYYEAMLTHDTAEKNNGRVEIHGVELTAGKQCIDYMYSGNVKFSLENTENLIYAAELMQLPALTDMYFEFLKEKLSAKNCLKYLQIAETFSRRSFAEFFKKSSAENFAEIIESEDFPNISLTLLEQCLVSSPGSGLDAVAEALKWKAVTKWVNSDLENREKSFLQLFKMLNLERLTEEFLKNRILAEPLVKDSLECKGMILDAVLCSTKPKPDGGFILNVTGGFSSNGCLIVCHSKSRMLHKYEIPTKEWSRFARIPADIYQKKLDIVSVKGEVFLTSGDAVSKFENSNLIHLRETGHQPAYHQCVAHGTVIYIIFTDQTCMYDTLSKAWKVLPVELSLGEGFFVASSDRFIYAMGGSGTGKLAKEFDFSCETWEPMADMLLVRSYGAAVWSDKRVYALGGYTEAFSNQCNQTEYYSPESNLWTLLSSDLKCVHYNCKAFSINGKVYIVGGVKTSSVYNTEVRCPGCWRQVVVSTRHQTLPCMAETDLINFTSTVITSMEIDTGLSCAVNTSLSCAVNTSLSCAVNTSPFCAVNTNNIRPRIVARRRIRKKTN